MRYGLVLIQDQSQQQQQRIDPKIIMANTVLQLSSMELQQAIEQELIENPALETEDEDPCSGCELAPFGCKDCSVQQQREVTDHDLSLHELEVSFDFASDPIDDEEDPIGRIQSDLTLDEHLRNQLRNNASGRIAEIADYLVNYINESGYLECDLLEITLELDATDEELEEAVQLIQSFDPPGVGARDLRECMAIQLKYLAEEGKGSPTAERIVRTCWDEMIAQKVNRIARRLKVKPEQVRYALKFIRNRLNPYPAAGFRAPWDTNSAETRNAIRPDVIIRRTPTGYEIEIVSNDHLSLAVNPYYRQMHNEMKNGKSKQYSEQDKKHITEYVERADLFIKNLNQRRRTLRTIAKNVVEYHHGFLDTGSKLFLRPLTRVKLAEMVNMHESTVSRATANKYVQLPSQEVVPFDFFFNHSHSLVDMIVQLIEHEDPSHPLSDQEIADVLTERGIPVARRTVVKYREAQKILSSRQRRRTMASF